MEIQFVLFKSGRIDWRSTIKRLPIGDEIRASNFSDRDAASRSLSAMCGSHWKRSGRWLTLRRVERGVYSVVVSEKDPQTGEAQ